MLAAGTTAEIPNNFSIFSGSIPLGGSKTPHETLIIYTVKNANAITTDHIKNCRFGRLGNSSLDLIASKRLSFHPLAFALLSKRMNAIVRIAVMTTLPASANAIFEEGIIALLLDAFYSSFFQNIYIST